MLNGMLGLLFILVFQPASSPAAAGTPRQSAPAVPASTAPPTYTIGPDDELKISVFDEPSLSSTYRVDVDGTITFPLLGRVIVEGKTVREVEQQLKRMLEDGFIRRAQVSVEMAQYRSRSIFIIGEVRTAGKYPLHGDVTLLELLALAGSLTANAGNDLIVVRARDGSTAAPMTPDNQNAQVLRVSLEELRAGRMSENLTLQDGDTIFVPAADRFYVSGHVRNPGSYVLTRGMTVQQAIAVAGGITDRGSTRGIKIRRKVGEHKYQEINVKLTDPVQANDTITIRQRRI
jgi:polysaccharide export outer membrane protein